MSLPESSRCDSQSHTYRSELFYRNLIADCLDGMLLTDTSAIISFVSASVKNILGYEAEELINRSAFDFVHPDDINLAYESFTKEVKEIPEVKSIVIRLLKKNNEWLWCMVRGHNLLSNPYVAGIVIYFHDHTIQKKASEALQESEQRFKKLISNLQVGVLLQDGSGNIVMSNNVMLQLMSTGEEELKGRKIWEVFTDVITEDGTPMKPEERPTFMAIYSIQPVRDFVMGVLHPTRKERVWMIINSEPIVDAEGNVQNIVSSFTDITERKKLEQKLVADRINQQKMITQATIDGQEKERREIGRELHDNIGQQLTTTKLFLDLAKSSADDATNEMISMALKSISDLINEIRGISRALMPSTLEDLGLIDSISELIESISRIQPIKIDFDYSYFNENTIAENKKLMLFRIIQEQLNNIIKYAGASYVTITLHKKDDEISLEIIDNGKGFKTNSIKSGSGLKNIQSRAELFGGYMLVKSQPGKGCRLQVLIPVVQFIRSTQ
ncbi:MAG: PAS domain S-box protein [Chitinophagaceae bacterium]|nr:PAS domain S-box protein [Chitinophagaceae bacterium]